MSQKIMLSTLALVQVVRRVCVCVCVGGGGGGGVIRFEIWNTVSAPPCEFGNVAL